MGIKKKMIIELNVKTFYTNKMFTYGSTRIGYSPWDAFLDTDCYYVSVKFKSLNEIHKLCLIHSLLLYTPLKQIDDFEIILYCLRPITFKQIIEAYPDAEILHIKQIPPTPVQKLLKRDFSIMETTTNDAINVLLKKFNSVISKRTPTCIEEEDLSFYNMIKQKRYITYKERTRRLIYTKKGKWFITKVKELRKRNNDI